VQTKRETQLLPQISVITVVKNDSKGLRKTISSLVSQTFSTWECLIISARSEDDTQTVANEIADSDDRVLHFHESQPGIYEAMNQGLELAKAPAIIQQVKKFLALGTNHLDLGVSR
jgi:glycosyltransferase involved in cell wall biosynthesis